MSKRVRMFTVLVGLGLASSAGATERKVGDVGPSVFSAVRSQKAVGPSVFSAVRSQKTVGPSVFSAVRTQKTVGQDTQGAAHAQQERAPQAPEKSQGKALLDLNVGL